ncbi:MAG: ATP-binding protein [Bacteroidales bacterium]|nr:ATP-binding protein [Bacteroidales bacterium]
MKDKITNPFVTGGYISPQYFCDRVNETDHLLKAISSRRNITLISLRRMGKTGLLKHVKQTLENENKSRAVIYVDLMPTMNGNDMLNAVSSALLRMRQDEKNVFEKILTLLASLRPRISYDSLTGQPSLELKVESPADIQLGLGHLLTYISGIQKELVFMLDEFQQICRYPEENMEQLLRSVIQTFPGIPFIFSGSSKHMLEPMFSAAGRPFYQSTELMYLNKIEAAEYRNFIVEKMEAAGKKILPEVIDGIFSWTRLHTFYVQYICNLLFESGNKLLDKEAVIQVFQKLLVSYEPLFVSYRNLIPSHQFKLLQAIAVEDGIAQPTANAFIAKHTLTSASSVGTSLKALAEKEMIVHDGNQWLVYDVFFSRWLEYHYGNR